METMESYYRKVHTRTDYILAAGLLVIAVILFFVHKGVGITLAVCSGLLLLFQRSGFLFEGQKDILSMKSFNICGICRNPLMAFLEGQPVSAKIEEGTLGGIVRLEIFWSEKSETSYARVYDFVDYVYTPAGPMVSMPRERAERLMNCLSC